MICLTKSPAHCNREAEMIRILLELRLQGRYSLIRSSEHTLPHRQTHWIAHRPNRTLTPPPSKFNLVVPSRQKLLTYANLTSKTPAGNRN
jgi:hypothetical protein